MFAVVSLSSKVNKANEKAKQKRKEENRSAMFRFPQMHKSKSKWISSKSK